MSTPAPYPASRWLIASMGTLLQLSLGAVYAWSYFKKPLAETYHWSNSQVTWTFSLAIGFLGVAAAVGGVLLPRFGPRKLAVTGSILYGAGYLLAALALQRQSLPLLWLGYGVVGGIGLGLCYVTPVATAAKWFPDKKGLVTGMVVMGFGLGAALMSVVIAPALNAAFDKQLPQVFACIGVILGMTALLASCFLRNPPTGQAAAHDIRLRPALFSRQFALMWSVFFCNIAAGIAIISFQSPMLQDLWKKSNPLTNPVTLAYYGGILIAMSSLFNGLGRFSWGALSDRLGQLNTFRLMLATQVIAFGALMLTTNPWIFGALICYILLCYGGGFGVMPAFVLNVFGPWLMPVLYGCILTAWSAAGVAGPSMTAWFQDHYSPQQAAHYAFALGAGLLALGFLLSLLLTAPVRAAKPAAHG